MGFLVWGVLILLGFVAGYVLAIPALVGITTICVIIGVGIVTRAKEKELESVFAIIFIACATVANVSMWVTYFVVTKPSWLEESLKYILR